MEGEKAWVVRVVGERLIETYVSKLGVLAIGINSAMVGCEIVLDKQDKRRSISIIVCNGHSDQNTVRNKLGGHPDLADHTVNSTKKVRLENYRNGGIFLVSKMKFCLDVVEEMIDPKKVDKLIYINEYDVTEYDPLSLCTNVLKRFNDVGGTHTGNTSYCPH